MIELKNKEQIQIMRRAGAIVAETLQLTREMVRAGVTTGELDRAAEEYIIKQGAVPAFKGYDGFPATLCTSVNEEVVHGIPGSRKLCEGDIISIDCGAIYKGYCGDAAITAPVGEIDAERQRLLDVCAEALARGIAQARPDKRLFDVSSAVQVYVEENGMSVVRDYVGHGIGRNMHEDPQVPNFGRPGRGPRLTRGMVIAIEPMVNLGGYQVETLGNNWTVATADRRPSAHFEHTVAITEDGPEILTKV
ncbi:MAG: type I methionyl aminopeptidase [Gracilibacteraceae bacterium]|jgi:methionyl aminopeptidase|nr:type I methionyl aminopeptidase [Gracilibacteraceae bacterium]